MAFCNLCHGRVKKVKDGTGRRRCVSCKSFVSGPRGRIDGAGRMPQEVEAENNRSKPWWWLAMGLFMGV